MCLNIKNGLSLLPYTLYNQHYEDLILYVYLSHHDLGICDERLMTTGNVFSQLTFIHLSVYITTPPVEVGHMQIHSFMFLKISPHYTNNAWNIHWIWYTHIMHVIRLTSAFLNLSIVNIKSQYYEITHDIIMSIAMEIWKYIYIYIYCLINVITLFTLDSLWLNKQQYVCLFVLQRQKVILVILLK